MVVSRFMSKTSESKTSEAKASELALRLALALARDKAA
jgi:hypothetical protein